MDPIEALEHAGGAARWAELIRGGVGRGALARAVERGQVAKRLYGTYALPSTPDTVWLAAAFHARVTCVSLCEAVGLPLLRAPRAVHLLVPEWRGLSSLDTRPTNRVTFHRSDLSCTETEANPLAAAIDLASRCVDRYAQLALVDAALRTRALRPGEIHTFHHTSPEQRRWLVDHSDDEAQSIMESYARAVLTEAGLWVRPQAVVGPRGHRDLLVEGLVIVELDGWETHGKKPQFVEDRRRDRSAIHDGKVTLRYTFDDLFGRERADLVADVEAALRLLRSAT